LLNTVCNLDDIFSVICVNLLAATMGSSHGLPISLSDIPQTPKFLALYAPQ
jgi:hypothetical protein